MFTEAVVVAAAVAAVVAPVYYYLAHPEAEMPTDARHVYH